LRQIKPEVAEKGLTGEIRFAKTGEKKERVCELSGGHGKGKRKAGGEMRNIA